MPHDRHQLGPLLLRSRAGDADARNSLLDRIRPFLKALIRSWIGPALCGKLADTDIVQETLLSIDQHLGEFRGEEPGRFLAWARTIAYRAAIDCTRKLDQGQQGSGPLHAAADPGLTHWKRSNTPTRCCICSERLSNCQRGGVRFSS